jgi:hypothetical protein
MAAGVLNILNAILAFIGAMFWIAFGGFAFYFGGIFAIVCGVLALVGGIFSLLAGMYCFKRVNYGMCLAGSILGMIFGGSIIFGLIALILVVVGKDDFVDRPAPAPMMAAPMPYTPYPQYGAPAYPAQPAYPGQPYPAQPSYAQPMPVQPMAQQPAPAQPATVQPQSVSAAGQWKYCSNCGNQVASTAMNCPKCGAKVG